MDVGAKIKAARLAKGMTQEELGEILGVQKSAIAKYESGRVVNIKRSTLKKISDVLGIPPYELVFDESYQKMQKNNDILSDVVIRARTDSEFLEALKLIYALDRDKLSSLLSFLK